MQIEAILWAGVDGEVAYLDLVPAVNDARQDGKDEDGGKPDGNVLSQECSPLSMLVSIPTRGENRVLHSILRDAYDVVRCRPSRIAAISMRPEGN